MIINPKKIAVSFAAVILLASFCFPFLFSEWDTAHAEGPSKEITTINGFPCAANEVLIKFKDTSSKEAKANTLDAIDPGYESLSAPNMVKITIPEGTTLEAYLDELNQNSEIEYAQPNFAYKVEMTVNDPYTYPSAGQYYQWFHDTINTFEAWDYTMGAGVTVAVLDTGAWISHEDLGSNITLMPDIATSDNPGAPADDDDGHGSHVTGIIGATANNSLGGAGVAPAADVLVYDVFDYVYDEELEEWVVVAFTNVLVNGIDTAAAANVDIINMSLGGYYTDTALENAVDNAVANGTVVVCSAGNLGVSDGAPDYEYHVPSDYDSAISVISTDYYDDKAASSNYGPSKDISAPGDYIVSTVNSGSYEAWGGTSMASPIIAGVCALILSADPSLTVDEVKNILYSTADDLGAEGRDDYYGWGRVNAYNAVLAALDKVYKVELDHETLTVELGHTGTLAAAIYPDNAANKNVTWESDNEAVATVTGGVVTGESLGTTTIRVTTEDGGYTDTCEVNVVPVAVTGVTLDKHTSEIIIGGSDTLTATVAPEDAANKNITWSSNNEAVATVADGVITSVAVGTTTITVTTEDGGFYDTCDVEVVPIPVAGVTLNKSTSSLYVGASEILKATVSPDNAANKNVTWESSAPGVVEVDSSGMITAVSAGSATITVTTMDGGHTDDCSVTVSNITPVTIDDTIKVKLSIGSPTYIYFYIDGNYSVLGGSGQALERQQYRIVVDGSTLRLYYGSTSTQIYSGTTITLVQHEATSGNNFVWIDNYEYGPVGYLGNIVFSISGGAIQAVNHVYLDEYLYGVVSHEMDDSWPAEALKAQAVAARSYAASSMGGGSYDVVDTSASQVYKGFDDSDVNTIAAVDATQKQVLQYGNVLKKTYFAASNGGYTDSPLHVWPSGDNMPYAIYEDPFDAANAYSPYEKIFFPVAIDGSHPITSTDNVDGYIGSGTPSITNAVAYIKSRILASGQLSGYGVTTVGDFSLTGVLDLVPHTYDTDSGENHSVNLPDGTNDCVDFVGATGRFTVSVGASSYEVSNIELDLHYFDGSEGKTGYEVFNMSSLRLFVIDYEDGANPGWAIYQRRYGHGVGLSQRGAQQRANQGQAYDYMLSFYYPYTSLMDLSYSKDALTSKVPVDNSNAVVDCSDYLNVRSGPSTSYSIVGTLPAGARIQVLTTGDWHTINYGGVNCYVSSDYVDLDGYVAVTGVSLDESSITLDKGASRTLVATITPSNATNKSVTWSTSDATVATVSSTGEVTAVGGGTATITVTTVDHSRTDTCDVTVQVDVTGVTLDESSIVVYMGKTRTLTATIEPADATDKTVTWSSDNEGIVTVTGGVITPVSEGTTFITVTTNDGGFYANCNVTVGAPPTDAIYSPVYTVDQTESLLLGVPDEITITDMVANLDNAASDIVVRASDDTEITDWSTFAGTGMKVQLVISESVVDELNIVVLGDIDGNGVIDIIDYSYVKLHIYNVVTLADLRLLAGDINKDDVIDIIDYSYVKLDIFDVAHIN